MATVKRERTEASEAPPAKAAKAVPAKVPKVVEKIRGILDGKDITGDALKVPIGYRAAISGRGVTGELTAFPTTAAGPESAAIAAPEP